MHRYIRSQRGMSLIEVMIATIIVALSLTSLVMFIGATGMLTTSNKASETAATLVHKEMERIRNLDFDHIGLTDATGNEPPGILDRQVTTTVAGIEFTINYEIEWVDVPETDDTSEDYKQVTVIVNWEKPRAGSYRATSFISKASQRSPGKIIVPPPPEFITPPTPSPDEVVSGDVAFQLSINDPQYLFSALEIRIGGGLDGIKQNIQPPSSSAMLVFNWDSALYEDGRYEVQGLAYEARGGTSERSFYIYVDNSAPTETPALYVDEGSIGPDRARVYWSLIHDGNEAVYDYYLMQSSPDTRTIHVYPDPTDSTVEFDDSYGSKILESLSPWTEYVFTVKGYSHGDYSPLSNAVSFKTRIALSYDTFKYKGKWYVRLYWTPAPEPEVLSRIDVMRNGLKVVSLDPNENTWVDPNPIAAGETRVYLIKALKTDLQLENESNVVSVTR